MTESELAAHVVAWLQDQRWTVHEEVYCGSVADIVAVMDRRIWVIETKRTMGVAVMDQADQWRQSVHWVSVATPGVKVASTGHDRFVDSVLKDRGIGRLVVGRGRHKAPYLAGRVEIKLQPKMVRRPHPEWVSKMRSALVPENAAGAPGGAKAGAPGGGYWTTWKATCRDLLREVERRPGMTLKAILDEVGSFHYQHIASARGALSSQLREGVIPGIRIKQDGRALRLYPENHREEQNDPDSSQRS
jgi:hypothetical protein